MHNSPALLSFGDLVFASSFVPAVLFLAYYAWPKSGARWWKTPIGRMFVISQISLILVSIVVILSLTLGQDYPGRDYLRILAYGMHSVAQWIVLATYFRVRHNADNPLPKTRADEDAPVV